MSSSGTLRRVALVRTDVSDALSSSETSVLTRATQKTLFSYGNSFLKVAVPINYEHALKSPALKNTLNHYLKQ
jgi:hypothetical protein